MGEDEQVSSRSGLGHDNRAVPDAASQRWQKIKELFVAASERNPKDRVEFLNQACGSDNSLRAEVDSLLAASESEAPASALLNTSVMRPLAAQVMPDLMVGHRAGAYQLVRRIGTGGMAAVYLAVRADDQYQKQVAVKIVQPQSASDELLNRFRTERQTLAGLDHPNIVKLLDGGSTDEGLPYLVMDYVEGAPIDEYCDARKLSIEARLRLCCQVCSAVDYAHQHLVVHRDLKPSNILVTSDGAPKLLDFGIAKVFDPHIPSQAPVVTQTATRRMTPAYASPEQVRGESITVATDIYSLGVVLYELLTGRRPYKLKQSTPAEIERAICEEEPEKLSTAIDRVETITTDDGATSTTITPELVSKTREGEPEKLKRRLRGDLDNVVLMALQKEPERRYASVKDLADDLQRHLDHLPVQARPSTLSYRASKFVSRHKTEVVSAALLLFVLAGGVFLTLWEARRARETVQADIENQHSKGRRSVAVLGFKNLSGRPETAWLSTALSEMLTTELAAGGQLRTAPGENIAQVKIDLVLPEADALSRQTLRRVRRNLNSDYVVLGSYLDQGENSGQIRLDLRLQDAVTGETLAAAADTGSEANLSDLISRAGAILRSKLGAGEVSPVESASVKASLPSSPEAARLYAEGLAKLRMFDSLGAQELLEKSITAEPGFALAHSAMADAFRTMGRDAEAKREAKSAFDLAGALPREQVLLIEASYRQAARDWDKAIEIYKTLFNFFPDNLDHGLQLVSTQSAAGRGADSLATIASLRQLPVPDQNDPRIDLAESLAANVVSDYKLQAVAAEHAIRKAQAIGARMLVARARIAEARAYMEMGEKDKAVPALSEAQKIFEAVGDRFHEARVLQQVGLAHYYQGRLKEAKETYEQALAIQRELGNRSNQGKLVNGIAMVLEQQGDLEEARQNYLLALALCREVGDRAMTGTVLGNLAGIEGAQGDFQAAKGHLQESLEIARQVGEQSGIALGLENLAHVLQLEGNPSAAKPMFEEAVEITRKTGKNKDLTNILSERGDLQFQMGDLFAARTSYQEVLQVSTAAGDQQAMGLATIDLGQIQFEEGELAAARKSYEQALAILEKIGATTFVREAQVAMAELDLEDGRALDAERESRVAAEEFRKAKDSDSEANAQVLLVRAILAQHRNEEAQGIAADATKVAAKGGRTTQIAVACANAEVQTASGKAAEASNTLKQIVNDSHKTGFVTSEFEARLALSDAEIKAGNSAAGRAELRTLERNAKAKGFVLIARKAAAGTKQH